MRTTISPTPASPARRHGATAGRPCGKRDAGRRAHLAGHAAEAAVADRYSRGGATIAARRWRGSRGEIDLVLREGAGIVFVEVKRGRDFARAAERLTTAQIARITGAAAEFLGTLPTGELTPARFDLATVDAVGRVEVLEGAFGV